MRSVTFGFSVWLSVVMLGLATIGEAMRSANAQQPAPANNATGSAQQPGAPPQAAAMPSLESLLKSLNIDYIPKPNNVLEVIASTGADPMIVYVQEGNAYTDATGKMHKLGIISSPLLKVSPEKTAKPPLAMLIHMSEMNDRYDPGKLIFVQKTGSIVYESSFWLSTATPETLNQELVCAILRRKAAREELGPYLKDE